MNIRFFHLKHFDSSKLVFSVPYKIDKKNSTGIIIQTWLNEFLIGYFTTHICSNIRTSKNH